MIDPKSGITVTRGDRELAELCRRPSGHPPAV
jgi:hypothetical protein